MKKVIFILGIILISAISFADTVTTETATIDTTITVLEGGNFDNAKKAIIEKAIQPYTDETGNTYPILMLYLFALAGVIIHYNAKIRDAQTKKIKINHKQHIISGIVTVIISFVLIYGFSYLPESVKSVVGSELNPITSFLLGYFADSIFKNLTGFKGLNVNKQNE